VKHAWKSVITSGIEHVHWCANCGTLAKTRPYDKESPPTYFIIGTDAALNKEPRCRKTAKPEIPRLPTSPTVQT
jgi:hypothetical protein